MLLTRQHFAESWAREYGLQVCAAVVASGVLAYVSAGEQNAGLTQWLRIGLAFGATCTVLIGVVLLEGTSSRALIDSLIIAPSKLGSLFCVPLRATNYIWSAAGSLVVAAIILVFRKHLYRLHLCLAAAKGIYGILGTLVFAADAKSQLCFLLPWVWLVLIRKPELRAGHPLDAMATDTWAELDRFLRGHYEYESGAGPFDVWRPSKIGAEF